jgi:hypothetical protein
MKNETSPAAASASLLILTVGTGTAGPQSNLTAGLRRTIEMLAPRKFWLVPSASEDSRLVAECVAENFPNFAPYDANDKFRCIPFPDDLESCRQTLRQAISQVRAELEKDEKLIINPTSGTKQMSAGATLAALDENIGNITFTIGERANGVVITGTERLTDFNAATYFREHDFSTASELFEAGAFHAAARILERHRSAYPQAYATALVCHYWQMFNYDDAANAAKSHCEDLRRAMDARRSAGNTPSRLILGDLIAWAIHARRTGDADAMFRLAYKALEYAGRCALYESGITPDQKDFYDPEQLKPRISPEVFKDLAKKANPRIALGLNDMYRILGDIGHPLGHAYAGDEKFRELIQIRNETVHAIRPTSIDKAHSLLDRVQNLLKKAMPGVPASKPPGILPKESV